MRSPQIPGPIQSEPKDQKPRSIQTTEPSSIDQDCTNILTLLAKGNSMLQIRESLDLTRSKLDTRLRKIAEDTSADSRMITWLRYDGRMSLITKEARELASLNKACEETVVDEDGQLIHVRRMANPSAVMSSLKLQAAIARDSVKVAQALGLTHKEPDRSEVSARVLHVVASLNDLEQNPAGAAAGNLTIMNQALSASTRIVGDVVEGKVVNG